MKKLLFFALGLVGICTAASAQTGFGWGVKGGLNITGMTNSEGGQSKTGFVVGAFADYRFTQKFALSVDALYSRQGISFGKTEDIRSKTRLNYLNVPILANYYIFDGLAVKAGIQPGFLLSGKAVAKGDGHTEKEDISGALHGADFAIPIGISYDCPFGIILEARYNIGVSNVLSTEGTSRNSVFALTVGYRF